MGKLNDYSFNKIALSDFIDNTIPANKTNLIAWSEVDGTIQSRVIVACNCTKDQIDRMNFWFSGLKVNDRSVNVLFVQTQLGNIPEETDVLLIRDYKSLDDFYSNFKNYVAKGVGIVEMMDFPGAGDVINSDRVQKEIFGLRWVETEKGAAQYVEFKRKPNNSTDITYVPYKYFYHVPLPLNKSSTETLADCAYQPSAKGYLVLNQTQYAFWICSSNSVWFDTDANGVNDTLANLYQTVTIGGF